MLKKLKKLFILAFVVFGLFSCNQAQTYTFKDITTHEISDIDYVSINYGPMMSAEFSFEGDYENILNVEYVLSDMSYNNTRKIIDEYRFHLFVDLSNLDIDFYVYNYKLYYFSEDALYESKDKVDYDDFEVKQSEIQTLHQMVMLDYGRHISNKVTTLLDCNFIWFNPSDYGIDELVAGDELIIKYTGEYRVQEIYPGQVNTDKINIQSIEVIEADIVEFKVLATPGSGDLDLVPVDSTYDRYVLSNSEGYVVSKDGSFKKYSQYSSGTVLYASLPKTTGTIRVDGLYDYNPRGEKVKPTGQFKVSINDKGNNLIDELSHDAGMYTPGMVLEFYSYPIMDADLAMYVNNEFSKIQDFIEVNDNYM